MLLMFLVMSYVDEDSDEVIEGAQALYMPEGHMEKEKR